MDREAGTPPGVGDQDKKMTEKPVDSDKKVIPFTGLRKGLRGGGQPVGRAADDKEETKPPASTQVPASEPLRLDDTESGPRPKIKLKLHLRPTASVDTTAPIVATPQIAELNTAVGTPATAIDTGFTPTDGYQFLGQLVPDYEPLKPPEGPQWEVNGKVIASADHPDVSQDTIYVNDRKGFGLVADGVGGNVGGHEASTAVAQATGNVISHLSETAGINETIKAVKEGLIVGKQALDAVHALPGLKDAGTTFNFARVCPTPSGGNILVCANIGDSRTYIWSERTQTLRRVSVDHSLVESLVKSGKITEKEAFYHEDRNLIYRDVGNLKGDTPDTLQGVDFYIEKLEEGDIAIVTSDGIHDNLTPFPVPPGSASVEMQAVVREAAARARNQEFRGFAEAVCEIARSVSLAGNPESKKDDMSAIAILPKPQASALLRPAA